MLSGKTISRRRKALGLLQRELAEEIGCSQAAVNQVENGARSHTPTHYKLSDYFTTTEKPEVTKLKNKLVKQLGGTVNEKPTNRETIFQRIEELLSLEKDKAPRKNKSKRGL